MDLPFKVESLPDMRENAGRVRFSARDMTPVEEREGIWRLPKSYLLQPVKDLASLYNREYFNTIVVEQAKAKRLSISFDNAMECLWVENDLISSKNQMVVIIVLPKPLEPRMPRGMEALIDDYPTPEEPQRFGADVYNNAMPAAANQQYFNSIQAGGLDGDRVEGAIAIEKLRKNPTISLSKPKASTDSKAITPERDFQPINPHAGDILQLYENDGIHVINGGIAIMVLRYKTKTLNDQ
ncbi:hypothetical protein RB597_010297 [Gaeumannomyces tritici]